MGNYSSSSSTNELISVKNKFDIKISNSTKYLDYDELLLVIKYLKYKYIIGENKNDVNIIDENDINENNIDKNDIDIITAEQMINHIDSILAKNNIDDDEDNKLKTSLELFSNSPNAMSINVIFIKLKDICIYRFEKKLEKKVIFSRIEINNYNYGSLNYSKTFLNNYIHDIIKKFIRKEHSDIELIYNEI